MSYFLLNRSFKNSFTHKLVKSCSHMGMNEMKLKIIVFHSFTSYLWGNCIWMPDLPKHGLSCWDTGVVGTTATAALACGCHCCWVQLWPLGPMALQGTAVRARGLRGVQPLLPTSVVWPPGRVGCSARSEERATIEHVQLGGAPSRGWPGGAAMRGMAGWRACWLVP